MKNMDAESWKKLGRGELWSPSTITRFLSPAYASCSFFVWCGATKSSPSAAMKRAGMKHSLTWSIGVSLSTSNFAFPLMVFLTDHKAVLTKKSGNLVNYFASSFARSERLENGLSRIIPAMVGSLSPCNRAVTAPIDLPHRPTVETCLFYLR